jgi:hypothetical protein
MGKVTVYHFKTYNHDTGQQETSQRPATLRAIKQARGTPIPETALVVDKRDLDPDGFYRRVDLD